MQKDSQASLLKCNEILSMEIDEKRKIIKDLKSQLEKQKKESKKLLNKLDERHRMTSHDLNSVKLTTNNRKIDMNMNKTIPVIVRGNTKISDNQKWQTAAKKNPGNKKVLIIGDESVRNLGSMMNKNINTHVTVRGGYSLEKGCYQAQDDIKSARNSNIVFSYGIKDLEKKGLSVAKKNVERFVAQIVAQSPSEQENQPGILSLFPQRNHLNNNEVELLNKHIENECKKAHIGFIEANLNVDDVTASGTQAKYTGRVKICAAITQHVQSSR